MKNFWVILIFWMAACKTKEPLIVVAPKLPSSLLVCLAQEYDLWEGGIKPQIVWTDTAQEAFKQYDEKKALFVLANLSNYLPHLLTENNLTILSEVYNSTRGIRVVVPEKSRLRNSKALIGRKIGFVESSASEIFLEYFLLTEGVNLGAINKFPFELEQMKQSFVSGKIDAMVVWEPELSRFKLQYPNIRLIEFRSFVHSSKGVLLAKREAAEERKSEVKSLLRSLVVAENFYKDNFEAALDAYHKCIAADTEPAMIRESLADVRGEVKLSNSLRQSYDRNREWLVLRKAVDPSFLPAFYDVIESKYLRSVRARSVTVGARE